MRFPTPLPALILLVPLSVAGCGSATDGGSSDPDAGSSSGADAANEPDAAPPIPNIDEAFGDCTAPGEAGGLAGGTDLIRVDIDRTAFPQAQCSDGTTPLFFVRKATNPAHANKWLFLLQGGGGCKTPEACARRWCSEGTNFGANKLSSRFAPTRGTTAKGILANRADNIFDGWNQVFLYYCTSDHWAGTQESVIMEAPHPVDGGDPVQFRVSFAGGQVFDAVVSSLRGDGVPTVTYTDGVGAEQAMPDLDDASEVVLAGASAGGGGVINNIDRFAETLRTNNNACGASTCPLDVSAIIDSSLGADLRDLDVTTTPICSEWGFCTLESFLSDEWSRAQSYHAHRGDESCVSWHEANDPSNTHMCVYTNFVLENHITTPFFVRMGLRDSLMSGNAIDAGFSVPAQGGAAMTLPIFASMISQQLMDLPNITSTANEASAITKAPGVFGPPCPKHETLRSNADTYDVTVGSPARKFLELVGNWRAGTSPTQAVLTSSSDPFTCP
jgi:hypothetical protein